ncbi:MAG: electron transfer flavoprotein subunit alpha/FixB family protein [Nitrososphaerales archaeon]|jgi:electron transfer flavoprotein alpha subunit
MTATTAAAVGAERDVWVYLQMDGGSLSSHSRELIAAGRRVADKLGQRVVGVLLGRGLGAAPGEALAYGADRVLAIDDPLLGDHLSLRIVDALEHLVRERRPAAFLFLSSEQGKDLAPRLACRLRTGLATDTIELEVEDYTDPKSNQKYADLVIQIRPDFGTRLAKIYTPRTRPQMATVTPGSFEPLPRDASGAGEGGGAVEHLALTDPGRAYGAVVTELRELPRPSLDLQGAEVIVCLGLGVLRDKSGAARSPREAYDLAMALKRAIEETEGLKTEIGATRSLIYSGLKDIQGLITEENQVGQSGVAVSPRVYFALGVSGAVHHNVGMQKSKKIVAVNVDPFAPILQIAHYPIVDDLYDFLPDLIARIRGAKEGEGKKTKEEEGIKAAA